MTKIQSSFISFFIPFFSLHFSILHPFLFISFFLLFFSPLLSHNPVSSSDHHHEVHREDHDTKVEKVGERKENQSSFHASDSDSSKHVPILEALDSSSSLSASTVSQEGSDQLKRRVERENYLHVSEAIDSLLNVDAMSFESSSSNPDELVKLVDESKQLDELTFSSSGDYHILDNEADIGHINLTYVEILNKPRSDSYSRSLKETARNDIITRFKEYKLETFTQSFTASKRGSMYKGTNVIGILPGRYRGLPDKDDILLLGAHYDTVETSPGIDDNGSGVIATLEVARILSNRGQLNHTVIFTAFDLEELVSWFLSLSLTFSLSLSLTFFFSHFLFSFSLIFELVTFLDVSNTGPFGKPCLRSGVLDTS